MNVHALEVPRWSRTRVKGRPRGRLSEQWVGDHRERRAARPHHERAVVDLKEQQVGSMATSPDIICIVSRSASPASPRGVFARYATPGAPPLAPIPPPTQSARRPSAIAHNNQAADEQERARANNSGLKFKAYNVELDVYELRLTPVLYARRPASSTTLDLDVLMNRWELHTSARPKKTLTSSPATRCSKCFDNDPLITWVDAHDHQLFFFDAGI